MMWDGGYGYGLGPWIGWGCMMFFGLLFLVGLVVLVMWIARSSAPREGPPPAQTQACDIARMRYARGEITREQLEEICRTLGER